jgi:hypothetical protein
LNASPTGKVPVSQLQLDANVPEQVDCSDFVEDAAALGIDQESHGAPRQLAPDRQPEASIRIRARRISTESAEGKGDNGARDREHHVDQCNLWAAQQRQGHGEEGAP